MRALSFVLVAALAAATPSLATVPDAFTRGAAAVNVPGCRVSTPNEHGFRVYCTDADRATAMQLATTAREQILAVIHGRTVWAPNCSTLVAEPHTTTCDVWVE